MLVIQQWLRKRNGSGIGCGVLSVIAESNREMAGSQENRTNENVDVDRAASWERQQLNRNRFAREQE